MRRFYVLGIAAILFALLPLIATAQSDTTAPRLAAPSVETTPLNWRELRKYSRGRVAIRRDHSGEERAVVGAGQADRVPARIRYFKAEQKQQRQRTAGASR